MLMVLSRLDGLTQCAEIPTLIKARLIPHGADLIPSAFLSVARSESLLHC